MAIKAQVTAPIAQSDAVFTSKLASSGLDSADTVVLKMSFIADCSSLHPSFAKYKGLKIPYFDIDGKETSFYRIRYLEQPTGFAAQVAKPQRYAQEPKSLNEVYLPPSIPWADIAQRPTEDILITEGELKAACAAKMGYSCLALGGVSVWSSAKRQIPLLEPLPQIDWRGRTVTIIFDSDAATNPNVARAEIALAKALLAQGAIPKLATLPPTISGEKQGLDDFLINGGDLTSVLAEVRSIDLGDRMAEINTKYAYVMDQDLVIELSTARRLKRDSFINGLMANHNVVEYQSSGSGNLRRTEVRVAAEWIKWASRLDVECITYEPGKLAITEANEYNTWRGWGCEAVAGDVTPWHDLLDVLFGGDEENKHWFQQWAAYPIQKPGTKLFTSAVMWGPETGTGKSLVGYTLGEIYGTNFGEIGNQELHASFNEWAINKQFILGDEITGSDKRHEADKLKALITQRQLRINMKNLPTYVVPDCINYYFTSNHPDAFFLDDQDRRFFIWRTMADKRREPEFYRNYMTWLQNGGREALFAYFLAYDTASFDPASAAPTTASKNELVDHARSDLSGWVSFFLANLDLELGRLAEYLHCKPSDLDLVLNKHLKWLYDPQNTTRVTPNGLGRELSRFGLKTVGPIASASFGKQRLYILRNHKKWLHMPPKDVADYVDSVFPPEVHLQKF
jgi:hypothetical protein